MIYAASDIHGYPLDSFLRLLEKAGFSSSDRLYVIGDVIDRNGDGGVAMLRWMMRQENVDLIRGNHESMMLECEFAMAPDMDLANLRKVTLEQEYGLLRWHRNGCLVTLESLLKLREEDPEELKKLLDYVRSAPLYTELAAGGRRFVLLHGGLEGFEPEKGLDEYSEEEIVWTRPGPEERYWEDRLVILGHTPTQYFGEKGRMFSTDTWLDIDTGAAGGGSPMLLRLDDLQEFYAE
ncbi:MAG: metallophosphoesterase [Clostridiales bacterium]|nr:metallophosphoesterase [Clostridiales bacterium]